MPTRQEFEDTMKLGADIIKRIVAGVEHDHLPPPAIFYALGVALKGYLQITQHLTETKFTDKEQAEIVESAIKNIRQAQASRIEAMAVSETVAKSMGLDKNGHDVLVVKADDGH